MIKMVVSDLDGSLLRNDHSISNRNRLAIDRLKEKGIKFVVATGRPDQLMKEYVDSLSLDDDTIMCNGAIIGHPLKKNRTIDMILPKDKARKIIEFCKEENIICLIYTQDQIISEMNFRAEHFMDRNVSLPIEYRSNFKIMDHIEDYSDEERINKILVIELNKEKFIRILNEINKLDDIEAQVSQMGFVDINPCGSTKGKALEIVASKYGIELKDVVAFGDQDNDITMLELAGIGVAMGNASEKAKSVADQITLSNENDGFAEWLERNKVI